MKQLLINILISTLKFFLSLTGSKKQILQNKLLDELTPFKNVSTKYGDIKICCLGNTSIWRADTFHTKEPETLQWIDQMQEDETLWDIGANIGLYSLYAAKKGHNVLSFEPSTNNTFLLYKNIIANHLSKKVLLMPFAASDKFMLGKLNLTSLENGSAFNIFDNNELDEVKSENLSLQIQFTQGMVGFSIDELIQKHHLKCPEYIKVDVDSIEEKIITGAKNTLSKGQIKSVLIELTEGHEETERIIKSLAHGGLTNFTKHQSQLMSTSGANHHYNYIFTREK